MDQTSRKLEPVQTFKLRVMIDGRKLGHGGIGVYTDSLITGLLATRVEVSVVVRPNFNKELYSWSKDLELIADNSGLYSISEYLFLGRRLSKYNFDIFHSPHYTLPYGLKSAGQTVKSVVTIHDLIQLSHPNHWSTPYFARPMIQSALNRASAVICVSQATKLLLEEEFNLTEQQTSKIIVIPNAIPKTFREFKPQKSERSSDSYFIANISTNKAHKGVSDLLEAYKIFRKEHSSSDETVPELVIIGQGVGSLSGIDAEGVNLRGEVSEAELLNWYRNALALIVPSLQEGFCLPALQAAALNVAVVHRPVPAILELAIKKSFLAADMSTKALAFAIEASWKSSLRPTKGEAKSFFNKEKYSVESITLKTVELYAALYLSRDF